MCVYGECVPREFVLQIFFSGRAPPQVADKEMPLAREILRKSNTQCGPKYKGWTADGRIKIEAGQILIYGKLTHTERIDCNSVNGRPIPIHAFGGRGGG